MFRRLLIVLVALVSCSSPPRPVLPPADGGAEVDAGASDAGVDAGPQDAGNEDAGIADGGLDAGLGCATCSSDADCDSGQTCVLERNGCSSCQPGAPTCSTCRSQSDCCGGSFCHSPNDPQPCGICRQNPHECSDSQPCETGKACTAVPPEPCSSCDPEPGRICADTCTATSCPEGTHCGNDGACQFDQCPTDFVCPTYMDCKAGLGDLHGCAVRTCTHDSDCTTGFCVNGGCAPSAGSCMFPVP